MDELLAGRRGPLGVWFRDLDFGRSRLPELTLEWEEARQEGCESPQELRLLKAIRADGTLPEPGKQQVVIDANRLLTRADFAYLDCEPKVLIYVDGLTNYGTGRRTTARTALVEWHRGM